MEAFSTRFHIAGLGPLQKLAPLKGNGSKTTRIITTLPRNCCLRALSGHQAERSFQKRVAFSVGLRSTIEIFQGLPPTKNAIFEAWELGPAPGLALFGAKKTKSVVSGWFPLSHQKRLVASKKTEHPQMFLCFSQVHGDSFGLYASVRWMHPGPAGQQVATPALGSEAVRQARSGLDWWFVEYSPWFL